MTKYKSTKNYKYVNYDNGPVWKDIRNNSLFGFKNGSFWSLKNNSPHPDYDNHSKYRSAANRIIK